MVFILANITKKQIEDWKKTALIDSAKVKNTRVLLTVSLQGRSNNDYFLSNALLWNNLYGEVSKLLLERDADGIDINFEDIPFSKKNEFVDFVTGFEKFLTIQLDTLTLFLITNKNYENFNLRNDTLSE